MKEEFKTVDTRTMQGFRLAEKLQANGWKVGTCGFHTILFYRPITEKRTKK